ncbi:MAG: IMPACT family member YigZ [Firmicutes bacterium ADurb.Bin300]|nr:MAG: IMPACT family member YigZ [Firmicutes bacterium ADurb.Bin300]
MHRLYSYLSVREAKLIDTYKTLKKLGIAEYVVKKSKFIGSAAPVKSDEEAVSFINEIRQKHRAASHNVYAYFIRKGQLKRYSDDGEPRGTGGVPVLNVILKENISNCAVVITRYFGGTLLGTGGLVRAYSLTAKLALDNAGIGEVINWSLLEVKCPYDFFSKLSALIFENCGVIINSVFETEVFVQLKIPSEYEQKIEEALKEASGGGLFFNCTGHEYGFK